MYIRASAAFVLTFLTHSDALLAQPTKQPTSGTTGARLEAFDAAMLGLMARWHLFRGQLAIAKDGRLVVNRGYGCADKESKRLLRRITFSALEA